MFKEKTKRKENAENILIGIISKFYYSIKGWFCGIIQYLRKSRELYKEIPQWYIFLTFTTSNCKILMIMFFLTLPLMYLNFYLSRQQFICFKNAFDYLTQKVKCIFLLLFVNKVLKITFYLK